MILLHDANGPVAIHLPHLVRVRPFNADALKEHDRKLEALNKSTIGSTPSWLRPEWDPRWSDNQPASVVMLDNGKPLYVYESVEAIMAMVAMQGSK